MVKLEFQREGPSGPRLVALLRDVEIKEVFSDEQVYRRERASPEIRLFSQNDLKDVLGRVDLKEIVRLGRDLRQGGEFSGRLGSSLLAAVHMLYQEGDYPVDRVLERRGLSRDDVGEVVSAMAEVKENNRDVIAAMDDGVEITRRVWDPFEVLRSHVLLRNVDQPGLQGSTGGLPHITDSGLRVSKEPAGASQLGSPRADLDKLSAIASDEGMPAGVSVGVIRDGVVNVMASGAPRDFIGVESVAAEGGSFFIKYRDPGSGELGFHVFETPEDGVRPTDRPITADEIGRKYRKTAEMFGIPVKR